MRVTLPAISVSPASAREMDFTQLTVIGAALRKLDHASQRQRVLAQNIANADTPGYRPMDLEPFDFARTLARHGAALRTSEPRHMAGPTRQDGLRPHQNREPYEVAPVGNAVILEEQLLAQATNTSEHQLATLIYQKQVQLLRTAMAPGQ